METLDADVSAAVRAEGREVFEKHGETGETRCPYPYSHGANASRVAWFDGFLEARTKARLQRKGVEI